ncbi:hypothetical protein [Bathycoccus sp. RCC716 virus 3]|nr:hypothetical protein [Bathycoccus sp. RCC716 virus 3]
MAGGLMQLVAYGAQDVYLTGNPKVTFFQAVYKRHTNFAMENIEQTVNGTPANSGRVSVTVARNGDLVGDMYVELLNDAELLQSGAATGADAANSWTGWVAERAIKSAELSIGGQRIDKHYQRWWRLYSELYLDEAKRVNYGKMTSAAKTAEGAVYLPLIFFFNRNPGLALPLIALQYHEVRIDFDLASNFATYLNTSTFKVWANYIYLDTEERRRFAQKGHEYLIEQVQHTGTDTVTKNATKQVRLSYNHPVKELVWCVAEGDSEGAQTAWNLGSEDANADVDMAVVPSMLSNTYAAAGSVGCPCYDAGGSKTASPLAYAEEIMGNLDTFKLVLNGQDRFKEQSGKYFNQVQPFQHHSGNPCVGVYSYSFALKPEEHQPTGTCNFSRIDNAQVAVKCKNVGGATSKNLDMFAVNYNVLRVQSGMGGLAFSN